MCPHTRGLPSRWHSLGLCRDPAAKEDEDGSWDARDSWELERRVSGVIQHRRKRGKLSCCMPAKDLWLDWTVDCSPFVKRANQQQATEKYPTLQS